MHRVRESDLDKTLLYSHLILTRHPLIPSQSLIVVVCSFPMFLVMVRLLFSTYAHDGSDTDTLMGFAYDATLAYFHAVDFMIKNKMVTTDALNSTHLSGRMIKRILAENITFTGVTGNVDFSSGRLGSKSYGYGDRSAGQGYVIFNFHNNATWGAFKRIGRWSDEHHYLNCDAEPNPNGNGMIVTPAWTGGCNLPMQTTMNDHVSFLKDRADDIIQRMPAALKVPLPRILAIAHTTALSYDSRPPYCSSLSHASHYSSFRTASGLVFIPGVAVFLHGDFHCAHHLRRQTSYSFSQSFSTTHDDVHRGWLYAGIYPYLVVLF